LIRLAIRVARGDAEVVLAELLELAPSGVEEVDLGQDAVEYAVYGAPGELPALGRVQAAAGDALIEVSSEVLADDWAERWRQFHRPLVLDQRLRVRPPWEAPGAEPLDIVIDPGRAFGTGAHPTTWLCLELMLGLPDAAGPFVDLGCGSGVLAIAAARLGFAPVLALDFDPAAIEATCKNAVRNGVELEARRFDLRAERVPAAGTVVANLLAPLLHEWSRAGEVPADRAIASGLLEHEGDGVAAAFASRGLRERERRSGGDWLALLLERALP
jgi:ribosomal protein L11 methyltransferase